MPGILSLPIEILENICGSLAPPLKERRYIPLRSRYFWAYPSIEPFKEDCAAMRLSCKAFSVLPSLVAALFYDFNVFATFQDTDNLELLSQHPFLRKHVHRLVFCLPRFQVRPGFLQNGELVAKCGRSISRFPNLASIFTSDSVPDAFNLDQPPKPDGLSLQEDRHLDPIKDERQEEGDNIWPADHHTAFVLRVLALARVCLREFVTYNDRGSTWEFLWDSVPAGCLDELDLSTLTRLDICLRDGSAAPDGADWSSVLCPLLAKSPGLTELYIRFNSRRNRYPTVNGIWESSFPRLAVLSLEQIKVPRTEFSAFLRRHVHLRELTFHFGRESEGRWYSIFTSIREHPVLEDLELFHLDEWRMGWAISTFHQPDESDDVTIDLYDYLHGDGGWTVSLSELWGDS